MVVSFNIEQGSKNQDSKINLYITIENVLE